MGRSLRPSVSTSASTHSMATERRTVLRGMAAAGLGVAWPGLGFSAALRPECDKGAESEGETRGVGGATGTKKGIGGAAGWRYLAARKRGQAFEAVVVDDRGDDVHALSLPDRGHSFAIDAARRRAVAFGRQPGFFATMLDLDGRRAPTRLALAAGRHFFGHGVFVDGGRLLLATANDFEAGRGVLSVYDSSAQCSGSGSGSLIAEFETGGVGPHEVVALSGTNLVVVANGGLLTHPDFGKMPLNLESMQSSLAYVDITNGEVVDVVSLPPELRQLSIRHLVVDKKGSVWFGCQYMGPASDTPALVGCHTPGQALKMFAGPPDILRRLRHYVGSVAIDAAGAVVATSSPVGGLVVYWDTETGNVLGTTELVDGCGVAPAKGGGFVISSGSGAMLRAAPGNMARPTRPASTALAWDNHLRHIPV